MSVRQVRFALLVAALCLTVEVGPALAARNNGRAAAAAAAARRQQMIAAAQAQIAQAKQVLAAAEAQAQAAQSKISDSNTRVSTAKSSMDAAKTEERGNNEALRALEAEILAKHGSGSAIGQAHLEYESAAGDMKKAQAAALSSDEFKLRVAAAEAEVEHAQALPKVRKEVLAADTRYQDALERYESTRHKYLRLKAEIIQKDPKWISSAAAIHDAHREESKASAEATKGALAKLPAKYNLRTAVETANMARATILQAEMTLAKLGVKPTPPPKTPAVSNKK